MTKLINITKENLSIDEAYHFVLDKASGGIVLFVGTVRNRNKGKTVTHLNFESYKTMAIKEMHKIADQIIEKFSITKVAILHREGHVSIAEKAVVIAVSSVHRKEAFQACEFAIDQLKEKVPIWKKEFLEDGSYWVGAKP